MAVVRSHDLLILRGNQTDAQGQGQDQTVHGAGQHQQLRRAAQNRHDRRGDRDEADDPQILVLLDRRVEGLQEGNRGVGSTDHRGDRRSKDHQASKSVSQISGPDLEGVSGGIADAAVGCRSFKSFVLRRICQIDAREPGHNAQDCQEQKDTEDRGDQDPRDGAPVYELPVFFPGQSGVDQSMGSGEGDIAPDGAAQKGQDRREELARLRGGEEGVFDCLSHRRLRQKHQHKDYQDHPRAEIFDDLIHDGLGPLGEEDHDRQKSGDQTANGIGEAEERIETQCAAAHVADIEGQTSQRDHTGQEEAQALDQTVGGVLPAQAGITQHPPDVQLGNGGHEQGDQND